MSWTMTLSSFISHSEFYKLKEFFALAELDCTILYTSRKNFDINAIMHQLMVNPQSKQVHLNKWLIFACYVGSLPLVRCLLLKKAQLSIFTFTYPRSKRSESITALHIACAEGHPDIVNLLNDHFHSLNIFNRNGDTPLHAAVHNEITPIVELLLTLGANPNLENRYRHTPHDYAVRQNNNTMANLLVKHGALTWPPLVLALSKYDYQAVAVLFSKGVNVNAAIPNGRSFAGSTALHFAVASFGGCHYIKLLLSNGANVDSIDHLGRTPLHIAAEKNYHGIAHLLIEYGANANVKNNAGLKSFEQALKNNHKILGRYLMAYAKEQDKRKSTDTEDSNQGVSTFNTA